jgi:hypothetical protein
MEILLIQKRLRWLGHVLRKPSKDMTKVALRWTPEGKGKRGRPITTWRRTIENEIKEKGYTWGTTFLFFLSLLVFILGLPLSCL